MDFLASFFSCHRHSHAGKPANCLIPLCLPSTDKKPAAPAKEKAKDDSATLSTPSILSKPSSSMACLPPKQLPPSAFLMGGGVFGKGERQVEWGSLVGVANCHPLQEKLLPSSATLVRIGRNEELRCLSSLRKNALDKLLVGWGELGLDFSLRQALRCRQPLALLVEDWTLMLRLLEVLETELLKSLGEYCLLESSGRIFFNIITFQNAFVLDFESSSLFTQHIKDLLQKVLSLSISEEDLGLLLEKMTLNDYVQAKKDPLLASRKLKHYFSEIQREKPLATEKEKETQAVSKEETSRSEVVIRHLSEALSEQDILRLRKESKSSEFDLEAEYLLQERQGREAPSGGQQQDQNLLIYYFNNEEEVPQQEFQIVLPTRTVNLVRKMRSKSQDATYLTEREVELDEEFFQKYQ